MWRLQAQRVAESSLVLIAHDRILRLVGAIHGLTIHGGRLAIFGTPPPDHHFIGQPDPLDNESRSPAAYGRLPS